MHRNSPHSGSLLVLAVFAVFALVGPILLETADARPVRGGARTSVHRGAHAGGGFHGGGGAHRGGANVGRGRDVSYNRSVNAHRDIDVDVDRHYGGGYYYRGYHPVARTAAAVGTAAVIGSVVYSLPQSCTTIVSGGVSYQQCGNTYYQPRYSGTQVSYVVANPP